MVEFNKDDGSDGQYVALKFESRDVAKEVYRRFAFWSCFSDGFFKRWVILIKSQINRNWSILSDLGAFYKYFSMISNDP